MPLNVNKEADAEFMQLLEKEDPERHRKLQPTTRERCAECEAIIGLDDEGNGPFRLTRGGDGRVYCSRFCRDGEETAVVKSDRELRRQQARWDKMAARQAKKTGELPTGWRWCAYTLCGEPFRPARATTIYCSPRCRYRGEQNVEVSREMPSGTRMDSGDLHANPVD